MKDEATAIGAPGRGSNAGPPDRLQAPGLGPACFPKEESVTPACRYRQMPTAGAKVGRGPSMYEMEGPRLALRLRRRSLGDHVLRGLPHRPTTRPKLRFPGASDAPGSPPAGARLQW